ncbi:MAG: hypothetical protein KAT69_02630, partial [Candidatus Aminicenantes bacterium]|nr:hypothetical protein [Candidatus Aminicenantes bacterium]
AEAPPAEETEAGPPAAPSKKKKINKMTMDEIEKKLEEVKSAMGGLDSKYARHLSRRKEFLKSLK